MSVQDHPKSTTPIEFAERLFERTAAMSTRMLAVRSGWSRSTISELRAGRRLPTQQQLADLLGAAGADEAEIADFEQLRQRCTQPVPPPTVAGTVASPEHDSTGPLEPSADSPSSAPALTGLRRRRWAVIVGAAVAIVGAGAGGFALGRVTAPTSGTVAPTAAVVAHTENLGVMTYTGPNRATRAPGTLPEGARILISCQVGDGEPLTDRVDGTIITWPVWDKLDDGRWIPDIYASTSKSYHPTGTATALLTC